jgi:hypothetical protein
MKALVFTISQWQKTVFKTEFKRAQTPDKLQLD